MTTELIYKVKNKKEFSQLPNSIIERALEKSNNNIKEARAILRKFFSVFLTKKLLSGKLSDREILEKHLSTKNRNYEELYKRVFNSKNFKTVIDLGCGVNGFSYKFMPKNIVYVGIEAMGQIVKLVNNYFKDRGFENANILNADLFDLAFVLKILKQLKNEKPRVVFLFNVTDAIEFFEKDFSKKFLLAICGECEEIILSFPTKSLSGKTQFVVRRKWLLDFLKREFEILDDFKMFGERFLIIKNKK